MMQLKPGDTIAFVGNSDYPSHPDETNELRELVESLGLQVKISPLLWHPTNDGKAKAEVMHTYFRDEEVQAIFDISGGNRANSVLPFLDFKLLEKHPTAFFGYSDVTTILNSLLSQTQQSVELFQLKTILWDKTGKQLARFQQTFLEGNPSLYQTNWQFIQGMELTGKIVGGNIRCFLKLAGTPFMPDLTDKILFLESSGGNEELLFSMFHQLQQQANFQQLKGILLGTFTAYEQEKNRPIEAVLQEVLMTQLPIAKTNQIGHGKQSNALTLGKYTIL